MPTEVISTIGATSSPTTPDYTTLQAWEDACPADLVAADQVWIGECLDQGEFVASGTVLHIAGATVDATRNVILRCATGASFRDKAGVRTSALTYNASNGVGIRGSGGYIPRAINTQMEYVHLFGLQLKGETAVVDFTSASSNMLIDSCILHGTYSGSGTGFGTLVLFNSGNINLTVRNSLIIQASSSSSAVGVRMHGSGNTIAGCTFIGTSGTTGTGIHNVTGSQTSTVKNCAVFGFANFSQSLAGDNVSYNATDLSGIVGSNNQESLTFADQFESTTVDFRAKSTGGLKAGTPDATNTPDDITGLTRDATTPWIGAWEVEASSAYPFWSVEAAHSKQQHTRRLAMS